MIARAVPIDHRPPYKRIDLSHPNRKPTITLEDVKDWRAPEPGETVWIIFNLDD